MNGGNAGFWLKTIFLGLLTAWIAGLPGCHSAFVEATIENQSATPVRLVEVDYPSASFGVSSIESHAKFHYRFKIQGSGPLKMEFSSADGKLHESDGPTLNQGQEGNLSIIIQLGGEVSWHPYLTTSR